LAADAVDEFELLILVLKPDDWLLLLLADEPEEAVL